MLTPPRTQGRTQAYQNPILATGTKVPMLTPPRTQGRTQAYQNPAKIGQLAVSSSEGKGKQNFYAVVGRERAGCAIYYKTVSWFAIDIGKGRSLSPTAYTGCIFFSLFFLEVVPFFLLCFQQGSFSQSHCLHRLYIFFPFFF
jgi:hypothetical protein